MFLGADLPLVSNYYNFFQRLIFQRLPAERELKKSEGRAEYKMKNKK